MGKIVAVIAALFGTIILALPIAVVGVTFDDEWVKQAKINKFAAESCVYEYNQITRNGTRAVPDLLSANANPGLLTRLLWCVCRNGRKRVAPRPEGGPGSGAEAAADAKGASEKEGGEAHSSEAAVGALRAHGRGNGAERRGKQAEAPRAGREAAMVHGDAQQWQAWAEVRRSPCRCA